RHERDPAALDPEVADRDGARVREAAGGLRLADEALARAGAREELGLQELQRERLAEQRVLDLEDDAHAARADPLDDPVLLGEDRARRIARVESGAVELAADGAGRARVGELEPARGADRAAGDVAVL